MDPQTCWEELCERADDGELQEAAEHAQNLAHWIERGGARGTGIPIEAWDPLALRHFASIAVAADYNLYGHLTTRRRPRT